MFQFTDDCLIGIKELDDEHRRLFSLINQAMDILNHTDSNDRCTQITHLLEELTQYADTHFAHEGGLHGADPRSGADPSAHAALSFPRQNPRFFLCRHR